MSMRAALQRLADTAGRYINDYAEASPEVRDEIRRHLGESQYDACEILQRWPSGPGFGYELVRGPEIPQPVPFDWTMSWSRVEDARQQWVEIIDDAARFEDAWGLLCVAGNGDVTLRDVLTAGASWEATRAHAVYLLVAREDRR